MAKDIYNPQSNSSNPYIKDMDESELVKEEVEGDE